MKTYKLHLEDSPSIIRYLNRHTDANSSYHFSRIMEQTHDEAEQNGPAWRQLGTLPLSGISHAVHSNCTVSISPYRTSAKTDIRQEVATADFLNELANSPKSTNLQNKLRKAYADYEKIRYDPENGFELALSVTNFTQLFPRDLSIWRPEFNHHCEFVRQVIEYACVQEQKFLFGSRMEAMLDVLDLPHNHFDSWDDLRILGGLIARSARLLDKLPPAVGLSALKWIRDKRVSTWANPSSTTEKEALLSNLRKVDWDRQYMQTIEIAIDTVPQVVKRFSRYQYLTQTQVQRLIGADFSHAIAIQKDLLDRKVIDVNNE